jgi:transposase
LRHLSAFSTILQANGYAGFDRLYMSSVSRRQPAGARARMRRKFYDIDVTHALPIAAEALDRIARLYAIETDIRGQPPDERCTVRQARAGPELHSLLKRLTVIDEYARECLAIDVSGSIQEPHGCEDPDRKLPA